MTLSPALSATELLRTESELTFQVQRCIDYVDIAGRFFVWRDLLSSPSCVLYTKAVARLPLR